MEQAPYLGWRFHVRTLVVAGLLGALDSAMAYTSIMATIENGASMHILFGFEVWMRGWFFKSSPFVTPYDI